LSLKSTKNFRGKITKVYSLHNIFYNVCYNSIRKTNKQTIKQMDQVL
jgi:hypothetical protein